MVTREQRQLGEDSGRSRFRFPVLLFFSPPKSYHYPELENLPYSGRIVFMGTQWLNDAIKQLADLAPEGTFLHETFNIRSLMAVILVCVICGAVGSLVVGNRMAFFSDALAHCAFAGVALGLLIGLVLRAAKDSGYYSWGIPLIMVVFGVFVGIAIAFVREKTSLANDTVIGVFFAGAIGIGAMFFKALNTKAFITPENFLFGDPLLVSPEEMIFLFILALVTLAILYIYYNQLLFTSFNPSLARSRQISQRVCNYLFIVLLALIVNLCLKTVGALLINALLIVPAATAANLARNMRQMFWYSILICLFAGIMGSWLSWSVSIPDGSKDGIAFGSSGAIVVLCVTLFFLSMPLSRFVRGRQPT